MWLAKNQVLPDCINNGLLWPKELPPWKEVVNQLSCDEFVQQCRANPRALYAKLLELYQKSTGDLLDCDNQIAEVELKTQFLEVYLVLLHREKNGLEQKWTQL
ncbi:uncharacterized protein ACHE_10883S [Aspergillus chevalieri]|uniref:Uncharacterized protein n=1 Tax=Aspergillus chevalieri TaxID=182096 RepID=A0A7R7ZJP4_ASPCH|nr:uncharacterized protein ACHE_10883S [Aspergillus chevalieri]BCR83481.1 hypothetical protein ACHE_10883S [Aspergillus chevalieri]